MNKEEKGALVGQLAERLGHATITLVSEYRGMTVAETTEMRRKLRVVRGELKVAKNTLIRRAIKDTRLAPLEEKLGGPVGLIIGSDDPVELAKSVVGFRGFGDKFKLRGGMLDGRVLSAEEVQQLAVLPPREVVISQLLALMQAPASRLLRLLNEPGSALARLIDAIGKSNAAATQA